MEGEDYLERDRTILPVATVRASRVARLVRGFLPDERVHIRKEYRTSAGMLYFTPVVEPCTGEGCGGICWRAGDWLLQFEEAIDGKYLIRNTRSSPRHD